MVRPDRGPAAIKPTQAPRSTDSRSARRLRPTRWTGRRARRPSHEPSWREHRDADQVGSAPDATSEPRSGVTISSISRYWPGRSAPRGRARCRP
jgi:hypothetical protein